MAILLSSCTGSPPHIPVVYMCVQNSFALARIGNGGVHGDESMETRSRRNSLILHRRHFLMGTAIGSIRRKRRKNSPCFAMPSIVVYHTEVKHGWSRW